MSLWTSVIEFALRDLNMSIAIDPCYAMALNNRIIIEQRLGDTAAAARDRDKLNRCRK